jgi:uncharacterized membrane protein YeaQ/YmgE (transglycosylase-associated protein family)
MGRIILGVIVGFIAWSILWVGGDEMLGILSPAWYNTQKLAFEKAAFNNAPFEASWHMLVFHLVRSVIASLMAGFLAAFVANENRRTTLILGVLLLIVGIAVQSMVWSILPIWYHLAFLLLLIPVTVAGGYLKKTT